MPFIWNDEHCLWIDFDKKFNTNEYVVVRKLFIKFQGKVREQSKIEINEHNRKSFFFFSFFKYRKQRNTTKSSSVKSLKCSEPSNQ